MKFAEDRPIYKQLQAYFIHQMITKQLQPSEKLPSVRQLSVNLTVNVNTMQRALSELVDDGLLETKRGLGNFVTQDEKKIQDLKEKSIQNELEHCYNALKKLELTPEEMMNKMTTFIQQKEEEK